MRKLVLLALVGLAAQLVDGSLGMGYGMTSSSLLLLAGLSPALASASVHLAEIGTTLASGASHWRLGNTDPRLVVRLGLPGAVGASEFLVTVAASAGFFTGLGTAGISLGIVLTLMAGGLVAAPISAWLVSRLPGAVLGTAVGGLILATNLRVLLSWAKASAQTGVVLYSALGVIWAAFLTLAVRKARAAATEIREETEQVLEEVHADPPRGHEPETAVLEGAIAAGGPVTPRPVEPTRPHTHAVLVVEPA